ncbi:MAG TPA: restriction endonuclease subunit S, partial [Segetibacter sp.]
MPKNWKWEKLAQIAKWGSGGTPLSTNPAYYNGEIPWLIIGDMNDGNIYTSQKKITKLGLENSSAKIVAPESILIAMYGSIGKLGINKIPVATNQAIAYTEKLNENINNKFLFHYLFHIRSKLHGLGKGG